MNPKMEKSEIFSLKMVQIWGHLQGHSYGPRFSADMVPFLVYFLILVVNSLARADRPKWILRAIFLILVVVSFSINFRGATTFNIHLWNAVPT